jgi:enterochelin esterase family protein
MRFLPLLALVAFTTVHAQDMALSTLLIDGEDWKVVAEGLGFADGPMTDADGNFYFCDMRGEQAGIYKVALDGAKTKLSDESVSGMKLGPDGRLYCCQGAKKRLIAINLATREVEVVAEDVQPNDLAMSHRGHIYFTETGKKQVTFVDAKTKEKRMADAGIAKPNGIALSPDQGTLAVSDMGGENTWTFRIEPDGSLSAKAPYMTMRLPIDPDGKFESAKPPPYKPASGGDGMATDAAGRFYVTSFLGVQVFDPTGRMCGVLPKPQLDKPLTSCALAGPGLAYLYITNGDKIFRRKTQATGHFTARAPGVAPAAKK